MNKYSKLILQIFLTFCLTWSYHHIILIVKFNQRQPSPQGLTVSPHGRSPQGRGAFFLESPLEIRIYGGDAVGYR